MDDRALRQRLTGIEVPVEPTPGFVDDLYGELAERLGHVDAPAARRPAPRPAWQRRILLIAATVALLLAMLGSIIGVGALIEQIRPQSVLDQIRESGTVRIALSPESPQVVFNEGAGGFDIDFADELALRLGARSQVVTRPARDIVAGGPRDWQLAMAGGPPPAADDRYLASDPYYWWPIYVVALEDGGPPAVAQLAGQPVCVVAGGLGETWLLPGNGQREVQALVAPPQAVVIARPEESACLVDLQAGSVQAVVTETMLPVDLATRRNLALVGPGSVAVEPRVILLERRQVGAEDLRRTLNELIAGMRADGTLSDLSRRWFGGQDLTPLAP
jgi:polar amino acid transport system substrate-binding protein